jgi:threonine dehydrogenase-like Zn-dependent dehydrogenase
VARTNPRSSRRGRGFACRRGCAFLLELLELIWNRKIEPGKVFDLELPLGDAAAGYEAMGERRAIKALLRP